MAHYDPSENIGRLREGLTAVIAGRATKFSGAVGSLVVVFDGEPTPFSGGRVLLFQQFLLDRAGVIPEIVRQVPACLKVFFDVGDDPDSVAAVRRLLATPAFDALCKGLQISQVQLGAEMVRPKKRRP
jgi:hypothetical protein